MIPYDPNEDAYRSWLFGTAEIRKAKIIAGKIEPETDEERQLISQPRKGD